MINKDWKIDSVVFSAQVKVTTDPLDSDFDEIAKCQPDKEFLANNQIRGEFYHFEVGHARLKERKLLFHSEADRQGIEIRHCVWWNPSFGSNGAWDPNGCTVDYTDSIMTKCSCQHFGDMTVLMEMSEKYETDDCPEFMTIIRYVGVAITIILLLVVIFVTLMSRLVPF